MAKHPQTPSLNASASDDAEQRYAAWLGETLTLAADALATGDVPVGAIVVDPDGVVIGRGRNEREAHGDPTAHAEIIAVRQAALARGTWRLEDCTLVASLEPCVMCAGAAVAARLALVVFGAWDPKAGACGSVWDLTRDPLATHTVEVIGGVRAEESAALLVDFFEDQRLR